MQNSQQPRIALSRILAVGLLLLGWTRAEPAIPMPTPAQKRLASLRLQLATLANTCRAELKESCPTGVLAIRYGFTKDGAIRSVVSFGGTIKDSAFLASATTRFGSIRLNQQDSAGLDSCTIELFGTRDVSIGPYSDVSVRERIDFLDEHRQELEQAIRTSSGDSLPEARIVFEYSLAGDGHVRSASIRRSDSHDSLLDHRLCQALEGFKFPHPSGNLIKDSFELHLDRKTQKARIESQELGSRSPESILRVIRAHVGGFRYTYESCLKKNPTIGGRISLKFTISPAGDIIAISIASSNTGNQELENGIMDKARRMKFEPIEKGNVTVTYAFVLDKN